MRHPLLLAAASVLALAACDEPGAIRISKHTDVDGGPLKAVSQLECPEQQGPLTRVRVAADGKSCDYVGPRGAEVTLRLIAVADGGDPEMVLSPLEKELNGLMPHTIAKVDKAEAEARAEAAAAEAEAKAAVAEAKTAEAEARAAADAARDAVSAQEDVRVSLPGITVRTEGDKTVVRMPGLRVDATDGGDAKVNVAGVKIDAHDGHGTVSVDAGDEQVNVSAQDDSAKIRTRKKGEGLRMSYVLVDEQPSPRGWRLVGYEARGPASGPVVAAVVRSKDRKEDAVFDAAKALVKANVGG
ncbi:MAG TPA: methyltransferase type 11 [Caulobacteraceae bacterium]|nr:methyltransferase type 11 [Caulobacteraceae bacterium]